MSADPFPNRRSWCWYDPSPRTIDEQKMDRVRIPRATERVIHRRARCLPGCSILVILLDECNRCDHTHRLGANRRRCKKCQQCQKRKQSLTYCSTDYGNSFPHAPCRRMQARTHLPAAWSAIVPRYAHHSQMCRCVQFHIGDGDKRTAPLTIASRQGRRNASLVRN